MEDRIAKVLVMYRVTPHSTTGVSPSELLLGRKLRTRLDLLCPDPSKRVEQNQLKQKTSHDSKAKARDLKVGDSVLIHNYVGNRKWLSGVIKSQTGPVSFKVLVNGHVQLRRCHL